MGFLVRVEEKWINTVDIEGLGSPWFATFFKEESGMPVISQLPPLSSEDPCRVLVLWTYAAERPQLSQKDHLSYILDFTDHAHLILCNLKIQKSSMCSSKVYIYYSWNKKLKWWKAIVTIRQKSCPKLSPSWELRFNDIETLGHCIIKFKRLISAYFYQWH